MFRLSGDSKASTVATSWPVPDRVRHCPALVLILMVTIAMPASLDAGGSMVAVAQLQLGASPFRVSAMQSLASEVSRRTSAEAFAPGAVVAPGAELFNTPIVFWSASAPVPDLALAARTALSAWLRAGGTWVIDWAGGTADMEAFRSSVEAMVDLMLPGAELERIPRSSVIYRSFYKVDSASGRVLFADDLYGVAIDGRWAIILSLNDLMGAWDRKPDGSFQYDVLPGGEDQRENAIRLGVNIVIYALCLDYKDDKVHLEFLKSRRNWHMPEDKE